MDVYIPGAVGPSQTHPPPPRPTHTQSAHVRRVLEDAKVLSAPLYRLAVMCIAAPGAVGVETIDSQAGAYIPLAVGHFYHVRVVAVPVPGEGAGGAGYRQFASSSVAVLALASPVLVPGEALLQVVDAWHARLL